MTKLQIKKIDDYILEIEMLINDSASSDKELYNKVKSLNDKISSSVKNYNPIMDFNSACHLGERYTVVYDSIRILRLLDIMKDTIEGVLAEIPNYDKYSMVLNDIAICEKSNEENGANKFLIQSIGNKYSANFSFDKELMNFLNGYYSAISEKNAGIRIVSFLNKYADDLLSPITTNNAKEKPAGTQINIHNENNLNNEIQIDISVRIENTIQAVKDACIGDVAEKEILEKLSEIAAISKEKDKPKRWSKTKDIFKWLATQSLQAAEWVVPLVMESMK